MKGLQGAVDLIILQTLATMGPQHAYGIARRLLQISANRYRLNQGTLYPALVRLEQEKWIAAKWDTTASGREAKYYSITRSGQAALNRETQNWRQLVDVMDKLLSAEEG